jgi:uncharacterized low-complexity protein
MVTGGKNEGNKRTDSRLAASPEKHAQGVSGEGKGVSHQRNRNERKRGERKGGREMHPPARNSPGAVASLALFYHSRKRGRSQ